jgi:hypothetical protein
VSDARGTEGESSEQGNAGDGRESANVQGREARGLRESVGGGFGGGQGEERG